jgi:hypothetical protein
MYLIHRRTIQSVRPCIIFSPPAHSRHRSYISFSSTSYPEACSRYNLTPHNHFLDILIHSLNVLYDKNSEWDSAIPGLQEFLNCGEAANWIAKAISGMIVIRISTYHFDIPAMLKGPTSCCQSLELKDMIGRHGKCCACSHT